MTEILTSKYHANLISTITDFIVGDTKYWKLKYKSVNNAKNELEYRGECSTENAHWLSFHYAVLDVTKYHFELVKCKQINSYTILKALKRDLAKFHYGGNVYKTFQEYKGKEYDFHCRKLMVLGKKVFKWED